MIHSKACYKIHNVARECGLHHLLVSVPKVAVSTVPLPREGTVVFFPGREKMSPPGPSALGSFQSTPRLLSRHPNTLLSVVFRRTTWRSTAPVALSICLERFKYFSNVPGQSSERELRRFVIFFLRRFISVCPELGRSMLSQRQHDRIS